MMGKTQLYAAASAMILLCAASDVARAANVISFISSNGTGSACTRTAPCANVQNAIDATFAGGTVVFLDSYNGGTSTINKSLTIRGELEDSGTYSRSPAPGAYFTVSAGADDVVTFDGVNLNAGGIAFTSGLHLHIVGCRIYNNATANDKGIGFLPAGPSKLSVTDTVINNFGLNTGGGIVVNPQPGGSARVNLERVTVNGNAFGIAFDGGNSNGINATIADSMIGGNAQDGIIATTSNAPIGVTVTNSKSVNNNFGIRALGNNVTVRVKNSDIIGNVTGLSFGGGAALLSAGNNLVQANSTNGSFSGSVPLQ